MAITMITGGHGAGKTTMALQIAAGYPSKTYIATAEDIDGEMHDKIEKHKKERDESYTTIEEPLELAKAVASAPGKLIIVDCLTLWVNNLIFYKADIDKMKADFLHALSESAYDTVLVTNESSMAVVPGDPLSRKYLKNLANLNSAVAAMADRVCMMVSGIPLWIKGK